MGKVKCNLCNFSRVAWGNKETNLARVGENEETLDEIIRTRKIMGIQNIN